MDEETTELVKGIATALPAVIAAAHGHQGHNAELAKGLVGHVRASQMVKAAAGATPGISSDGNAPATQPLNVPLDGDVTRPSFSGLRTVSDIGPRDHVTGRLQPRDRPNVLHAGRFGQVSASQVGAGA